MKKKKKKVLQKIYICEEKYKKLEIEREKNRRERDREREINVMAT